jgi:AMP-binding enzyme C-terminal domain
VDGALLSHPAVAEAVSFGAPDEKYGEEVAAAVVLAKNAPPPSDALKADIRKHVASHLSKFKVRACGSGLSLCAGWLLLLYHIPCRVHGSARTSHSLS